MMEEPAEAYLNNSLLIGAVSLTVMNSGTAKPEAVINGLILFATLW